MHQSMQKQPPANFDVIGCQRGGSASFGNHTTLLLLFRHLLAIISSRISFKPIAMFAWNSAVCKREPHGRHTVQTQAAPLQCLHLPGHPCSEPSIRRKTAELSTNSRCLKMNVGFVQLSGPLPTSRRRHSHFQRDSLRAVPRCASSPPHRNSPNVFTRREALKLLTAVSVGALTTGTRPDKAVAYTRETDYLYDAKSGSFVPPSAMDALLRRDAGATFDRCIVAGEIHDNILTHNAQLAVIDSARRMSDGKKLIVGFEQFYRNHNLLLNDYVQGNISTNALLQKTDWDNVWGFEPSLYTPIFEYCRFHKIPMRGLNVPRQFVSYVTKLGLDGLPEEFKPFLPQGMDFSNQEHYDHFVRLMTSGHGVTHGTTEKLVLNRYYEVQVLWEEWMSQSVALSLQDKPDTRMVALIGSGHVEGRYGFPDRVQKRCNERPYTIVPRPVQWTHDDGYYMPNIPSPEKNVADLIWYTRRPVDLV